ncbi:hypothetical protein RFW13_17170 [Bacillus pumilus]|uniref:hypothetical protein n=1 Tax=Bacillus pumilus TaxID=1408 RepID=UPI0028143162|nr:hypothetical protein [Bacillus pumilus]MDR0123159.1 hypothetical protein [Bacillus pumilus]
MIEQLNKNDLFEYLQVLARLKEVGYKCDQEILEALRRFRMNSAKEKVLIMYVDPGRDYSRIVLIDMDLNLGKNLTLKSVRSSIREQAISIIEFILNHRPSKLVIDPAGIGQGLFDMMIEESRGRKVRISKSGELTYMDKII